MVKNINIPGTIEICTPKGAVVKTLEVNYDRGVTMWVVIRDGLFWAVSPIRFINMIQEAINEGFVIKDKR